MDDSSRIYDIEQRIAAIEKRLGIASASIPSTPSEAPKDAIGFSPGALPSPQENRFLPKSVGETISAQAKAIGKETKNVESYIGRWLLGVVGVIAVILGASFFLKYAFESNLIGPTGRVILGITGGLLFVILGEVFRSRIAKYSYILSGGGLALFYLSIYSAFHYYHLIGETAAFSFMIAVTAFGMILALWADATLLAALAVFGGFLTPYLASSGAPNDFGFFGYLIILNLGILAVAFFKKWHELTLLGFTATVINFASWYGVYYEPEKLWTALFVLTVFYFIFLFSGFAANAVTRKMSTRADLFVLTINAAWFFGWCYFLLRPEYYTWLGFIAAALGGIYILLGYAASLIHAEDKNMVLMLGAIAVVFLTIAIPLELKQNAITIAWAVEAAVLFILGFLTRNTGTRIFALGVLLLAAIRLVGYDSASANTADFILVFNKRFFTYLMVIAAASVMGYFAHIKRDALVAQEKGTLPIIVSLINLLILVAVTLEIFTFYDGKLASMREAIEKEQKKNTPVQGELYLPGYGESGGLRSVYNDPYAEYNASYRSLTNQRNAAISVFWALWAIILMALGIAFRNSLIRWSSLALFGVTIFKVFIIDLASLRTPYRIISFTALGFILLTASYLYFRYQKNIEGQKENILQ